MESKPDSITMILYDAVEGFIHLIPSVLDSTDLEILLLQGKQFRWEHMEIPLNIKLWLPLGPFRIPIPRKQQTRKEVTTLTEVIDIDQQQEEVAEKSAINLSILG